MRRIAVFLEDAIQIRRKAGLRASLRFVWSRIFAQSEMLFYDLRTTGIRPELPAGWHVAVVRSEADTVGVDLLCRSGGEKELRDEHDSKF